jgi:hypothetical protein
VDVEILDGDGEEARALLLSIDPLAALAETQALLHQRLLELTPTESPELQAAWQAAAQEVTRPRAVEALPNQFLILVTSRDEKHQVELLERFHGEGLGCRALLGKSGSNSGFSQSAGGGADS